MVGQDIPLTWVLVLAGAALFLKLTWWRWRALWVLRRVPGRYGLPLLGDLPGVAAKDLTAFVHDLVLSRKYPKIFKIYVGPEPWVLVCDVELSRKLMAKYTARPSVENMALRRPLDQHTFFSMQVFTAGEPWRHQRRASESVLMLPKALALQAPVMAQFMSRTEQHLSRHAASGEPLDLQASMWLMAVDAVGWTAFGVDLHASEASTDPNSAASQGNGHALHNGAAAGAKETAMDGSAGASFGGEVEEGWWNKYPVGSQEFGRNLVNSTNATMLELDPGQSTLYSPLGLLFPELRPLLQWLAVRLPDKRFKNSWKAHDGVREGCMKIIEMWKQQRANSSTGQAINVGGILARVLGEKEVLTLPEIIGLVSGTVIAGYETTGSTLAMCCYYLATHPEAQAKAQAEVDTVLQGKHPEPEDLERLPFIIAAINETLRLSPPGTIMMRQVADERLDLGDGIVVPKGTGLYFPVMSFMRDPVIWPRAEEFLPERHIQPGNEALAPSNPNAFMPFGHGPRLCVGYKYAQMEARMALARFVQRFSFETVPGVPPPKHRTSVTHKPDQVVLRVLRRA